VYHSFNLLQVCYDEVVLSIRSLISNFDSWQKYRQATQC